eukprot:scaffold2489_cov259-Pinguiococcus_pyrenoidosus.AAC.6
MRDLRFETCSLPLSLRRTSSTTFQKKGPVRRTRMTPQTQGYGTGSEMLKASKMSCGWWRLCRSGAA